MGVTEEPPPAGRSLCRIASCCVVEGRYDIPRPAVTRLLEGHFGQVNERRWLVLPRRLGCHAAQRIHDLCAKNSIPVWCGGMLESGVGRAHNIAMSTQPNFSLPGDVSASARYWQQDIITPEVTVTPQGTINVPTTPGIGFLPNLKRIDTLTTRKLHLT